MNSLFLNGMGKSGNHILYVFRNLLFPGNCCSMSANRDGKAWKIVCDRPTKNNSLLFLIGHYPWTKENEITLRTKGCQMILIIRDLRDTVAAYYRACESGNITVATKDVLKYFKTCNSKEKFIERIILDDFCKVPPGGAVSPNHFEEYFFPWMNLEFCYVTRFEDLIGSKGGGDDLLQKKEIKRLCEFIGLSQNDEWYKENAPKLYNPKMDSYVPGGGVGVWKKYFNKKNIETFEKVAGDLNRKLGYG